MSIAADKIPWRTAAIASVILFFLYGCLSLVNHYLFRTYTFDLGYYNKALYDFSHLRFFDFSLTGKGMNSIFADHFCPSLLLFSPFRFLFGSYTLIILQNIFILIGAWGAYYFIKDQSGHAWLPVLAFLHLGLMWPVFSAISFDFHDSVPASMALPWLLFFFFRKNIKATIAVLLFILGWKESYGIWMMFVFAGLFLMHIRDPEMRKTAALFAVGCLTWTVIAIGFFMPFFDTLNIGYRHFNFNVLGNDSIEVLKTVLTRPGFAFRLIWEPHLNDPYWINCKTEFLQLISIAAGFLLLLRPGWLLMAIPPLLQKVWNDDPAKWGVLMHYGIEFSALIPLATFSLLARISSQKLAVFAGILVVIGSGYSTVHWSFFREKVWNAPEITNVFYPDHYRQSFDPQEIYTALKMIPSDAGVSASNTIVSHLAMRKSIDIFPHFNNSDYILIAESWNTFPISPVEFYTILDQLLSNEKWSLIYHEKYVYLFKRNS